MTDKLHPIELDFLRAPRRSPWAGRVLMVVASALALAVLSASAPLLPPALGLRVRTFFASVAFPNTRAISGCR